MKTNRFIKIFIVFISILFYTGCSNITNTKDDDKILIIAEITYNSSTNTIIAHISMYYGAVGTKDDFFYSYEIANAIVKLNDYAIPYVDYEFAYIASDILSLNEGDNLNLSIEKDDLIIEKTLTIPYETTIISPVNNETLNPAIQNTILWDPVSIQYPDKIELIINIYDTELSSEYKKELPGDATSDVIPAGTLNPEDDYIKINVNTTNNTSIDGNNIHEDSEYFIINPNYVYVDTQ